MAEGDDISDTPSHSVRANKRLGVILIGVAAAMIGMAYASVPLYQLFCQVTGYGGTTQVAEAAPTEIGERVFTIRFNADTDPQLPWAFQPVQRDMQVKVGESGLALFRAQNLSGRSTAGTATFNVTPLKAGQYFNKVQCFCFTEQRLAPGASVDMPVSFFVDPAIDEDPNLDEVKTITLSYTFFPDESAGDEQQLGGLAAPETGEGRTVN
ncbi:MAG: cytochrome c oxidase assembly protein [Kiloniellaceae bacterium]